jgi:hypothetical protein
MVSSINLSRLSAITTFIWSRTNTLPAANSHNLSTGVFTKALKDEEPGPVVGSIAFTTPESEKVTPHRDAPLRKSSAHARSGSFVCDDAPFLHLVSKVSRPRIAALNEGENDWAWFTILTAGRFSGFCWTAVACSMPPSLGCESQEIEASYDEA